MRSVSPTAPRQRTTARLLALEILLFLLFLGVLVTMESAFARQKAELLRQQAQERRASFEQILGLRQAAHANLVYDYSYWDSMVAFIRRPDMAWEDENLVVGTKAYQVDAVWVFDPDRALVVEVLPGEPGLAGALPKALRGRPAVIPASGGFAHFFLDSGEGIFEVHGASIHDEGDNYRRMSPVRGYLYVARLWDRAFLQDLGKATDASVAITEGPLQPGRCPPDANLLCFDLEMPGLNSDKPFRVEVQAENPLALIMDRSHRSFLVAFALFTLLAGGTLNLLLRHLVGRPLRTISQALRDEAPERLADLARQPDEFGAVAKLIIRLDDLETERQQMQLQLLQADKMASLGSLTAGVAHEINNPLTIIAGYVEMLQDQLAAGQVEPTALGEAVAGINDAYDRVSRIVASLRNFARQDGAKPEPVDFDAVLRDTVELVQAVFARKQVAIQLRLGPERKMVLGSVTHLQQVLMNLLSNARDAVLEVDPGRREILMASRVEGDRIVLVVSDQGTGIAPEALPRLFDPFFTTKRPGQGTGMGLSITRDLLEQMGGTLQVDSRWGAGTRATVGLPRLQAREGGPL